MEFLNKQDYGLSYMKENIEMVVYSVLCFFVPLFIGHPQIVVGVAVNASLVLAAFNLRKYKLLPVILLPSLGVLSRGLIFGPFTVYLIYMIPFIWIGNYLLVHAIKRFHLFKRKNRYLSIGLGIAAKVLFLFAAAYVLVNLGVLPAMFLTAMGAIQLYTAVAGSAVALGAQKIKKSI